MRPELLEISKKAGKRAAAGLAVGGIILGTVGGIRTADADESANSTVQAAAGEGMKYRLVVPGVSRDVPPPTPIPEVSPSPMPEKGLDLYGGEQVTKMVNQIRKENGLPELTLNSKLISAGQKYSEVFMARADIKRLTADSHNLDGKPSDRAVREGYLWKKGMGPSEVLAWSIAGTREEYENGVINFWKNSPGHFQNILNPAWRDIGGGCYVDWVSADRLPGIGYSQPSFRIADCIIMFGAGEN